MDRIPVAELTADLLLTHNDHGDTAVHAAAYAGHLDQIPAGLLTAELLNVHNYDGVTPIHTAERNGHLDQIPTALRPRPAGLLKRIIKRIGDTQAPWS